MYQASRLSIVRAQASVVQWRNIPARSSYSATTHWACLDTNPPDVKGADLSVQDVNRYNIKFEPYSHLLKIQGRFVEVG